MLFRTAAGCTSPQWTFKPMTEIFCANADGAPSLPGAYVLAIEITKPVTVKLPGKPAASLRSGRYLYCGSAKGPGAFEQG
jgi:hypothetical protein